MSPYYHPHTFLQIKQTTQDLNARWDSLSRRTVAVLRRMRHIINVRDDFGATRKALIVWLSDLDMRLTNLEYLKEAPVADKINTLKVCTVKGDGVYQGAFEAGYVCNCKSNLN